MKKQLFLMAIMAGAICLTSCEQKQGPDVPPGPDTTKTDVKVTVNPHEVVLTAEEPSIRLAATLDPADATATIVWSSSDTTVATVTSRGYVEATGYGECYIYASVGKSKDSCHIAVKTFLESLIFNNAAIANVDTTYAKDPETGEYVVEEVTAGDGSKWNCYLAMATLYVFSDGFYVNNSGQFDGTEQGAILEVQAPMYYGTQYLNPEQGGVQFSLGEWGVFERDEETAHVGKPGKVDETEYVKQMKLFVEEFNAGGSGYGQYLKAAGETFSGTTVAVLEYDAEAEGYYNSSIPDAICKQAYFSLGAASSVSKYMRVLDFSTVTLQSLAMDTVFGSNLVTGLNLGYNTATDQIFLNDENVYYDEPFTTTFGEVPQGEEVAAAKTPMHMPILSEEPEVMANLEKQIKDKNIRVIRVK